eukprot:gene9520-4414_t
MVSRASAQQRAPPPPHAHLPARRALPTPRAAPPSPPPSRPCRRGWSRSPSTSCGSRLTSVEVDEETYEEIIKTSKRQIDMLFVRGDGVILISPPCSRDGLTSLSRLNADHPDLGGSTGTDAVRRAIVGRFFANAARQESGGDYTSVLRGAPLKLHPNSVLWAAPPAWIVYHENVLTKHEMVLSATSVEEEWLVELAPHFYERAQVGLKRPRAED